MGQTGNIWGLYQYLVLFTASVNMWKQLMIVFQPRLRLQLCVQHVLQRRRVGSYTALQALQTSLIHSNF